MWISVPNVPKTSVLSESAVPEVPIEGWKAMEDRRKSAEKCRSQSVLPPALALETAPVAGDSGY